MVAVAGLALAACGGPAASPAASRAPGTSVPAASSPAASTSAPASPAASATVAATQSAAGGTAVGVKDLKFVPAETSVKVGATVTWTNQEAIPHTVKWSDGSPEASAESPQMGEGDTYQRTFSTAGTYPYICGIHPRMTGTVTVGS
jgi:amicyanin